MSSGRPPRQEDEVKDKECVTQQNENKGEGKGYINQIKRKNEIYRLREKHGEGLVAYNRN